MTIASLNYYELAPGDSFAYGFHSHEKQEEVFVVMEGSVTFETEDCNTLVDSGEAIRFEPGEFQQGRNEGDERMIALAFGAPQEAGELKLRRDCDGCGERTTHETIRDEDGERVITR